METLPDLISKLPIWAQYTLAGLVLLATILELIGRIRLMTFRRWLVMMLFPPREGWTADCPRDNKDCLDPNIAWNKSLGARWSQMRQMRKGDHFTLFIKFPRMINRIRFNVSGDEERFPKRYTLQTMPDKYSVWGKSEEYNGTDIKLGKSRKIYGIRITVIEPRTEPLSFDGKPPAWSIFDIGLTQTRLLGLLKKTI